MFFSANQWLPFQLKCMRMQKRGKTEGRKGAVPTPTLEMFEEKQLLAACTALREDIARHKSEIIAMDRCLNAVFEVTRFSCLFDLTLGHFLRLPKWSAPPAIVMCYHCYITHRMKEKTSLFC